jgi:DNA gyrase/topoisomerase IV subunit A
MDDIIKDLYAEYGQYINKFRSFPFIMDGAKLVERRLLYSLYEVAKSNFVKSAKIVGHCIAHYHPHGDESAYSSLVGLVQNGFATGQGNWGNNIGVDQNPPAAQRYTEVKLQKDILDRTFEYIKDVPYDEVEMEEEPVFLPTMFPICLLPQNSYCQGMGFGYRTLIPSFKQKDLLKRLEWILDDKKGDGPIIKPISLSKIISGNEELETLLTTGRAKLEFKGKFKKIDTKSVVIESIPPSKTFTAILKKFNKEITIDKSLGWQDESRTSTKVRFTIVKPRMLKIEQVVKKLNDVMIGSVTYECHMCNTDGKVILVSIDQMLKNVHSVFTNVVKNHLIKKTKAFQVAIDELTLIGKIKPHLSIELKSNPNDLDKVITNISSAISCSEDILKGLFDKYTLARLFKISTDTQRLGQLKGEVESHLADLSNYIWKEKYLK